MKMWLLSMDYKIGSLLAVYLVSYIYTYLGNVV